MGAIGAGMGGMMAVMFSYRQQRAQFLLGRQAAEANERARIKQMRRYTYNEPFVPPTRQKGRISP